MTGKMTEFINKLSALCTEYCAEIEYTRDDDGVHVVIGEEDVCIGFPMLPDPGADILEQVDCDIKNKKRR